MSKINLIINNYIVCVNKYLMERTDNRQPGGLNDMEYYIVALRRELSKLKRKAKTFICLSPRDEPNNQVQYMETILKYLAWTKAIDLSQSQVQSFQRFTVNQAYLYIRQEQNLRIIYLPSIEYDKNEPNKNSIAFRQLIKQHLLNSQLTSINFTDSIRLFIVTSCPADSIKKNKLAEDIQKQLQILQKEYFMDSQIDKKITFLINVSSSLKYIVNPNMDPSIKQCKHYSKIVLIIDDEKPFYKFPKIQNQTLQILSEEKEEDIQQLFSSKFTSKFIHMIDHLRSSQDHVVIKQLYQVIKSFITLLSQIRRTIYHEPNNNENIHKLVQINQKFSSENWQIKNKKQFIQGQSLFGESDRQFLYAYILDSFNKTHDQVENDLLKVRTDHAHNLIKNDKNAIKYIRAIIQQLQTIKPFFPQILAQFDYSLYTDLAEQFFNAIQHMYILKSQHYEKISQLKDTYKSLKSEKRDIIDIIIGIRQFQKPNIDLLNHTQKVRILLLYKQKLDLILRITNQNKLDQKNSNYDRKKNQIKYEKGSTLHKLACLCSDKTNQIKLYKQSLQCLFQLYKQVQIQFSKDELLQRISIILKSLNRIDLTIQIQKFLGIHRNIAINYKLWMAEHSRVSNQSFKIIQQAIDYFTKQNQKQKTIQFYDLMISNNIPQRKHYQDQKKRFISEYYNQHVISLGNNNNQVDRNDIKILNQNFNRALTNIKQVYQRN